MWLLKSPSANAQPASASRPTAAAVLPVTRRGSSLAYQGGAGLSARGLVTLALLVIVPAAGTALTRGFDGLYGQDAYAYFDYATGPLRSALIHAQPWPAFFWPPGYPLLVALLSFVVGPIPVAGQSVSLVMGALVPVLAALLTRELWPQERWLPLLAGGLTALTGQLWQSSMVVMADTTGLALATLSAFVIVRYAQRHGLPWLIAATLALTLAILSRWIYGLVALPFAAYVLSGRPPIRHVVAAALVGAAVLAPVLGPSLLATLREPTADAAFAGNLQVYTWSPLNAVLRDFDTPDGHLSYARPNGLYYALAPANLALFGPLLAPAIAIGLFQLPKRAALIVVGWAAVVFAFHAGAPWQNFRFTLAYVPPLAILIALGVIWAAQKVGIRPTAAYVAIGVAVMLVGGTRLLTDFVDRHETDVALVRWTEAQVPADARLLTFGPTLTFTHRSYLPTQDLFDLPDQELIRPTPTYLLVDVANVEDQWQTKRPAELYHRLRNGPGLDALGTFGAYSLYRVGP